MKIQQNQSSDIVSCHSTEVDSCEDNSQEEKENKIVQSKLKTQLCKNYSEKGHCPYGKKCRFAHGRHEMVRVAVKQCFRKKRCNGFWKSGFCTYGVRCQFGHTESQWQNRTVMKCLDYLNSEQEIASDSRLLQLLNFE